MNTVYSQFKLVGTCDCGRRSTKINCGTCCLLFTAKRKGCKTKIKLRKMHIHMESYSNNTKLINAFKILYFEQKYVSKLLSMVALLRLFSYIVFHLWFVGYMNSINN